MKSKILTQFNSIFHSLDFVCNKGISIELMSASIQPFLLIIKRSDLSISQEEFSQLNEKLDFLLPARESIKQIQDTVQNEESIDIILNAEPLITFRNTCSEKLFNKILSTPTFSILQEKAVCVNILLISYLLWQKAPTIENITLIIRSLIFLITQNGFFIDTSISYDFTLSPISKEKTRKADNQLFLNSVIQSLQFSIQFYFSSNKLDTISYILSVLNNFYELDKQNANQLNTIYPDIFSILLKKQDQVNLNTLIDFLNQIYAKNQLLMAPETAANILKVLSTTIDQLNKSALILFNNFSQLISANYHSSTIIRIFTSLFNLIESQPPFLFPAENLFEKVSHREQKVFPISLTQCNIKATCQFIDESNTFQNGMHSMQVIDFCDKLEISYLFRSGVFDLLSIIIPSLIGHEISVLAIFSTVVQKLDPNNPYFYDYISLLILLYREINNPHIFDLFWNTILDSIIFDERINFFDSNKEFEFVDQLRSLIFDISYNHSNKYPQYLGDILYFFLSKPFLIDETIQRILSNFSVISKESLSTSKFIQTISSIMVYFQALNMNCDKSLVNLVEDTRLTVFSLIIKLFDRNKNYYEGLLWISNLYFISTFLSFIFEKPVRPFVLNLIKNYMMTTTKHFYPGVLDKLEEICSLMVSQVPSEQQTELACDLLQMINDFQLQRRRENISDFRNLSQAVISSLPFLTQKTKYSQRYLSCVISFLVVSGDNSQNKLYDSSQLNLLSVTIVSAENGSPSIALFPFIIQLLAGELLSTTNTQFIIKQPGVLNLILTCYIHSKSFDYVFSFVKEILQFSIFNVRQAIKVAFDCLLLDQINLMKNNENNAQKIGVFLDIIEYICKTGCSKETPFRFLNLLNPIQNKWISPFELQFIQTITDIIRFSLTQPNYWIPLGTMNLTQYCYLNLKGLTKHIIPQTFMAVLWIYLNPSGMQNRTKYQIFNLMDSKQRGIHAFISAGSLLITCLGEEFESTVKIDIPVPAGMWIPISFFIELPPSSIPKRSPSFQHGFFSSNESFPTFHKSTSHQALFASKSNHQSENCSVLAFIGAQKSRANRFRWDEVADGPISFEIGNSLPEIQEETPAAFLSSLSLYQADGTEDINAFISNSTAVDQVQPIAVDDSDSNSDISKKPFISVSIRKDEEGKLASDLITDSRFSSYLDSRSLEFVGTRFVVHTTFIEAMTERGKENGIGPLLLPLFTLIDYPTISNIELKEFPALLFDFLTAIFQAAPEQQTLFSEKHGMLVLSFLLNNSHAYVPSYSTYIRFYSSLGSFNESLQDEIISLFLLNHNMMINSSPTNQLRLAKHWNRVLTEAYPNAIKSITPLLVLIFEQFLQDEPIINQIRDNLYKIITKTALARLNLNDLLSLISLPLSSPIEYWGTITEEVIGILQDLIENDQSAIYSLKPEELKYLALANLYLQTCNVETAHIMITNFLRLVILMHRNSLFQSISLSLSGHLDLIMREMSFDFAREDIVISVANLAVKEKEPALLPMCFFLAANTGDSASFELIRLLNEKSFGFDEQTGSYLSLNTEFWAATAAIHASRDIKTLILKYLQQCQKRDDIETASMIEMVSYIFHDRTESLLREHLDLIAQSLNDQIDAEKIEQKESTSSNDEDETEKVPNSNLISQIENFFQLASQFLIYRRESVSIALAHAYEMSIYSLVSKEEKKGSSKKVCWPTRQITLISSNKSVDSDIQHVKKSSKARSIKTSFGDLRSQSMKFPKVTESQLSPVVSRSESFHKLLLSTDDLIVDSPLSSSVDQLNKMKFSPRDLYFEMRKHANTIKHDGNSMPRALGLRFDRNCHVIDHEVAFKCLTLFEKCDPLISYFIPFDLFLSTFLLAKNRTVVEKHLVAINLNQKQIKSNINFVNLLSKHFYYNSSSKKPIKSSQKVPWLSPSYDELSATLAYNDMENRRSTSMEKHIQKVVKDFLEIHRQLDTEIKEALAIRKNNSSGNNVTDGSKDNDDVYFIEKEVINIHSQEMIMNNEAEQLWNSLPKCLLFDIE